MLRKDILPNIKARDWIVLCKNNDRIILVNYKGEGYGLEVVSENDIDWDEYLKRK